ncbi:MAG: hypothetical protein P4M09_25895 [Devosia sp.]|nr:hypothetical protein [Devosia sp.]
MRISTHPGRRLEALLRDKTALAPRTTIFCEASAEYAILSIPMGAASPVILRQGALEAYRGLWHLRQPSGALTLVFDALRPQGATVPATDSPCEITVRTSAAFARLLARYHDSR